VARLSLNSGDGLDEKGAGVKHLVNIFRRLHRIFAHAWFQHRGVFWQVEGQTGLYVLFKTVCDQYELLPAENYKLPPEAEGLEQTPETIPPVPILKADLSSTENTASSPDNETSTLGVGRTNTRRHIRSSPSTGSAVTTVLEADEDDAGVTERLKDLKLGETESSQEEEGEGEEEEEPQAIDVPAPVEHPTEDDVTIIVEEEDHTQDALHPATDDKLKAMHSPLPVEFPTATTSEDQNQETQALVEKEPEEDDERRAADQSSTVEVVLGGKAVNDEQHTGVALVSDENLDSAPTIEAQS